MDAISDPPVQRTRTKERDIRLLAEPLDAVVSR